MEFCTVPQLQLQRTSESLFTVKLCTEEGDILCYKVTQCHFLGNSDKSRMKCYRSPKCNIVSLP